jgi:hypothetical protein
VLLSLIIHPTNLFFDNNAVFNIYVYFKP